MGEWLKQQQAVPSPTMQIRDPQSGIPRYTRNMDTGRVSEVTNYPAEPTRFAGQGATPTASVQSAPQQPTKQQENVWPPQPSTPWDDAGVEKRLRDLQAPGWNPDKRDLEVAADRTRVAKQEAMAEQSITQDIRDFREAHLPGQLEPASADPQNRSPEGSITVQMNGRFYLIPGTTPQGDALSPQDAIAQFQQTGEHFGAFGTANKASVAANAISKIYEPPPDR